VISCVLLLSVSLFVGHSAAFGFVKDAVKTVKTVVDTAKMLKELQSQLNNAMMVLQMIPTGIPPIPTPTFTLPAVSLPAVSLPASLPDLAGLTATAPVVSLPSVAFTLPATLPPVPDVKPAPTNFYTGKQVGVDVNNKGGWNRDAMGRLVNNNSQLVDENGVVIFQVETFTAYASADVGAAPAASRTVALVAEANDDRLGDGELDGEQGGELGTPADAAGALGIGAYVGIGVVGFLCVLLVCVLVFCVTSRSRDSASALEYNVSNAAYGGAGAHAPQANFSNWNAPAPAVAGISTTSFNVPATSSTWSTATAFDLPSPSNMTRAPAQTLIGPQPTGTIALPQFACPQCGKMYHYESDVASHVAARHNQNGF
jgi:hypothetical protein